MAANFLNYASQPSNRGVTNSLLMPILWRYTFLPCCAGPVQYLLTGKPADEAPESVTAGCMRPRSLNTHYMRKGHAELPRYCTVCGICVSSIMVRHWPLCVRRSPAQSIIARALSAALLTSSNTLCMSKATQIFSPNKKVTINFRKASSCRQSSK